MFELACARETNVCEEAAVASHTRMSELTAKITLLAATSAITLHYFATAMMFCPSKCTEVKSKLPPSLGSNLGLKAGVTLLLITSLLVFFHWLYWGHLPLSLAQIKRGSLISQSSEAKGFDRQAADSNASV